MRKRQQQQQRYFGLSALAAVTLLFSLLGTGCQTSNEPGGDLMIQAQDINILAPSVEESEEFNPKSFDYELARSKGLIGNKDALSETYLKLQAVYRAAFNDFLNRDGILDRFDKEIADNELDFVPMSYEKYGSDVHELYQNYGSFDRNYLFLRNTFFIEKLTDKDLRLLASHPNIDSKELLNMVERTYKSVVTARSLSVRDPSEHFTQLYDMSGAFMAPNGAAVLMIRYDWKYDENGSADHNTEEQKWQFITEMRDELQAELRNRLDAEVVVFLTCF
jgi:hypothetical protein